MITTRNWWYVTTRISRWQKSSDDYHICSVDWVSDSVLDMAGCMNHDHWKLTYITTELMKMTMTNLICSMDWRSGLSPPWQQKIFSSTMAATGRLQYFSSVLHFLFSIFKTNIFLVKCSQWWQRQARICFTLSCTIFVVQEQRPIYGSFIPLKLLLLQSEKSKWNRLIGSQTLDSLC